ncbi:winged helix-turn-helix transcriptional regulator [Maritalea sp.]|jgi:DNA-binding HxlR family transcriptional regulator|uniref:winged helix-turn-helix transcriptional regulator n=1 Tax=Maritalea sp. TaxID=2003361 RepID=UPI0039E69929
MRFENYDCSAGCPVEATLELIGGKWKGIALFHLLSGTLRYNELKRKMGSVTQRMLTKQLRELESDGLVLREVFAVVPPRVEYRLSEKGKTLAPVLLALRDWGDKHTVHRKSKALA